MSPCNDNRLVPPSEEMRHIIASLDPALDKLPETPEEATKRHEEFRKALEEFKKKPASRIAILPSDMDAFDAGGVTIEGLEQVKKRVDVLERRLENLIEAISINHVGHPPEGRSDACWSCKVVESAMGLRVAHKLMSESPPPAPIGGESAH